MRHLLLTTALCFVASPALGVTLTAGAGDVTDAGCQSPAALVGDAADPDVAWIACTTFFLDVAPYRVAPGLPLAEELSLPLYTLPGDLNGSLPNPPPTTSVFIDDVWAETATRAWVTTSGHETVAVFDPTTGNPTDVIFDGVVRVSVPTGRQVVASGDPFTRSDGSQVSSFTTSLTSGVTRVGNRLVATTSNLATSGATPVYNPGTVLLFDIDDSNPSLLAVSAADPPVLITTDFNPTSVTSLPGGLVAVVNSGPIVLTDPPTAPDPASIDIVDPQAGAIVGSIPLGTAGPAFRQLAVDPTGSVGLIGSAVLRQLYAVDLRGLGTPALPPGDPAEQRPSCVGATGYEVGGVPCMPERAIADASNPLPIPPCAAGCTAATDGFVAETRFGASGDFAVATAFNDGSVVVLGFDKRQLDSPHPLLPTRFGPAESLFATAPVGTIGVEIGPGPMILVPSGDGSLAGTGVVYVTNAPIGRLQRGTLSDPPATPTGNSDGDAIEDVLDNCPLVDNPLQEDSASVGEEVADGIGDACQCGDVSGDGGVEIDDAVRIERDFAGVGPVLPLPDQCNVVGKAGGSPTECDLDDAGRIRSALADPAVALAQICGPALP